MKRVVLLTSFLLFALMSYGQQRAEQILINEIIKKIDGVVLETEEKENEDGSMRINTLTGVSEYLTLSSIQSRIRVIVDNYSDVDIPFPWKRHQAEDNVFYYVCAIQIDMETGDVNDDKLIFISYMPTLNYILFSYKK